MICPHCQEIHPDIARFCPHTGKPIVKPPALVKKRILITFAGCFIGFGLIGLGIFILNINAEILSDKNQLIITQPSATFSLFSPSHIPSANNSDESSQSSLPTINIHQLTPIQSPHPNLSVTMPQHRNTAIPTSYSPLPKQKDRWIIYVSGIDNNGEIFVINPSNGQKHQITSNQWREENPSFSPDNQRIVYASLRSNKWELYVYDLRTGEEEKITSLNGQPRFPEWSPIPGDERIVF